MKTHRWDKFLEVNLLFITFCQYFLPTNEEIHQGAQLITDVILLKKALTQIKKSV